MNSNKMKGALGVAFTLILVASMMLFAIPTSAGPYTDALSATSDVWTDYTPTAGASGGWFFDPTISAIGPTAEAINGDLYAYVARTGTFTLLDSGDAVTFTFGSHASANFFITGGSYTSTYSLISYSGYTWTDVDGDGGYVTFTATSGTDVTGTWTVDCCVEAAEYADLVTNNIVITYPSWDIFKSTDGGYTWSVSSVPGYYLGGPVIDMVCSSLSEDILYVTDGNYVYKSVNGATTFAIVAEDSLETMILGVCGPSVVITECPITSVDVGYNTDSDAYVFVGVRFTYVGGITNAGYPSVLYINEAGYPSEWVDLGLHCFSAYGSIPGGYIPYSIGVSPNFATSKKIYVAVSNPQNIAYLTLAASGYVDCVPTDIGKVVIGGTTGDTGILLAYDNATRVWMVLMDWQYDVFDDVNEAIATISGIGAGFMDGAADLSRNDDHTFVVSSTGVTCAWGTVAELYWDCDDANNFQSFHASRFAFPEDYADTGALFIGVATYDGNSGDVYRVDDTVPATEALDLNVSGYVTGCLGTVESDICSLDISGSSDAGSLIAGAYYDSEVYYSTDGGWTWDDSDKDPTGADRTYVLWYEDTALAATRWCDAAFSMSCGDEVGKYFNQISLIHTSIDNVVDMSFSPGYGDTSSTMYIVVKCFDSCLRFGPQESTSVYRYDGATWERVYSEMSPEYADTFIEWVEVSPDFNDTQTLYIANSQFKLFRSQDAGCSWRALSYPCEPLPSISAWIVVDEETVLAAGACSDAGTIFKTERHGSRPWDEITVLDATDAFADDGVDFDLSPAIATDNSILFGDESGSVFLSADLGDTWAELSEPGPFGSFGNGPADSGAGIDETYVVFDPGYGTSGDVTVYAAAGSLIGRFAVGGADWVYLSDGPQATCDEFALCHASGIAAAGDTTLYVSDAGYFMRDQESPEAYDFSGTFGISYVSDGAGTTADPYIYGNCEIVLTDVDATDWFGSFALGEPATIISYDLHCDSSGNVVGNIWVQGLLNGGLANIPVSNDIVCVNCTITNSAIVILYGAFTCDSLATVVADCPSGVWRTVNPLDYINEATSVNLVEFEFLDAGLEGDTVLAHPPIDPCGFTFSDDLWLTAGSNVLWALDLGNFPYIWTWDDPLAAPVIQVSPADLGPIATPYTAALSWTALDGATSYEVYLYSYCPACPNQKSLEATKTTGDTCWNVTDLTPGTTYYWKVRVACNSPYVSKWSELWSFTTALGSTETLCSPTCGADNVILTPNFAWEAVPGATGYVIQVATDPSFSNIVAEGTSTVNAWVCNTTLDYSTSYYWQVKATGVNTSGAWAPCIFTTIGEPAEPVEPTPPVQITQTEITPTWIWVLIGIGGALTIAVIVLIVTTRRVP